MLIRMPNGKMQSFTAETYPFPLAGLPLSRVAMTVELRDAIGEYFSMEEDGTPFDWKDVAETAAERIGEFVTMGLCARPIDEEHQAVLSRANVNALIEAVRLVRANEPPALRII